MKKLLLLSITILTGLSSFAQELDVSLQLRPRLEYRNGYKTLLDKDQDATSFVSQRSRLKLDFSNEKLQLRFSVQNIRIWGDVPTMTTADKNGIAVFEALGTYSLSPKLSFSLGRQVLSYDNQRIFGEVDWAQQGQSHDAALLVWLPRKNQRLDLGFALNSDNENLFDTPYRVNNYKNMQFAWYHLDFNKSGISFLLLNTGYGFPVSESKQELQYMQTAGSYYDFRRNNWFGDFYGYGQFGKKVNRDLQAFNFGGIINYNISEKWSIGAGGEFLSGTNMDSTSEDLKSFTPLFGTNHAFNGFMDYFFVGNHLNSVGLIDLYGKLTYTSGKLDISLMPHLFSSAANISDSNFSKMNPYLGTEIDLTGNYRINETFSIAMGYSQMFGTNSLEILKGGNSNQTQNWGWLAVNFNSDLFAGNR